MLLTCTSYSTFQDMLPQGINNYQRVMKAHTFPLPRQLQPASFPCVFGFLVVSYCETCRSLEN